MTSIVTILERNEREAARRRRSASAVIEALRRFAVQHGGRFVVFGSVARGDVRHDCDLDILVDVAPERERQAYDLIEALGQEHSIPVDVVLAPDASRSLLVRIERDGVSLDDLGTAIADIRAAVTGSPSNL